MTQTTAACLTLGPVLFNWKPDQMRDFYYRMADEADVDTVCVGEMVCSKRSPFFAPQIPDVVNRLQAAGKQVIISSLGLIMTRREMDEARALCQWDDVLIEANDMSLAGLLAGRAFAVGPMINVYNEGTLSYLAKLGAVRCCLPAELSSDIMAILAAAVPDCALEVQGFGRLPLAISARCYHARSRNLAKDGCQYVCADDPDGMAVDTLEDEAFLAVNGTQTMSYHYVDALADLPGLCDAGLRHVRLWPHTDDMVAVAQLYRQRLSGQIDGSTAAARLQQICPRADFANGYLHGREGHAYLSPASS